MQLRVEIEKRSFVPLNVLNQKHCNLFSCHFESASAYKLEFDIICQIAILPFTLAAIGKHRGNLIKALFYIGIGQNNICILPHLSNFFTSWSKQGPKKFFRLNSLEYYFDSKNLNFLVYTCQYGVIVAVTTSTRMRFLT